MATATDLERDCTAVDSKHYTVEHEDDAVRVVRIRYGGNEESIMHQHRPGVGIFMTDADFTFTWPDGRTEQITAKRGDIMRFPEQWEHNSKNNTGNPFEAVYIEVK